MISKQHVIDTLFVSFGILNVAGQDVHVNIDDSVDVYKTIDLSSVGRNVLPFQFNVVDGDFLIDRMPSLASLKGCPKVVNGDFFCNGLQIESLEYAPKFVKGSVDFSRTLITSVEHIPQKIGGYCRLEFAKIKSLHNIHLTHPDWEVGGMLCIDHDCTHVLGLSLIPGIKLVRFGIDTVLQVIHDPFLWQEKLLELGLVEQAQL